MRLLLCAFLLLCPLSVWAVPGSAPVPPALNRTKILVQTLKRLADAMQDDKATVHSVSALVGPVKEHSSDYADLTPTDPYFSAGNVSAASHQKPSRLRLEERTPDFLDLTLAKGVVLTLGDLGRTFGKWHTVPINPDGGAYHVVFTYPDSRSLLRIAIFADLTGPPQNKTARVQKIMLRRDDARGGV